MLAKVKERHELIGLLPDDEISHMLRVGILVETLFRKMAGIDCKKAKLLGEAAFYHDVGKIYIPQQILLKNGELTETERNLIVMHSVHGPIVMNQMSKDVWFTKECLRLAMEAALYHHERWDGNGYPFGLKDKQIPFIGRLTSICDAYDAMTSDRPYRRRKQHEHACEELKQCSGIQFEPELVNIFLCHNSEMKSCVSEPETSEWQQSEPMTTEGWKDGTYQNRCVFMHRNCDGIVHTEDFSWNDPVQMHEAGEGTAGIFPAEGL